MITMAAKDLWQRNSQKQNYTEKERQKNINKENSRELKNYT